MMKKIGGIDGFIPSSYDDGEYDSAHLYSFDPSSIRVSALNLTVHDALWRIDRGDLVLTPPFQRRFSAWNKQQMSRLIESLFLNIPIPGIYVSTDYLARWMLIDGLHRLSTFSSFVKDEWNLSGMEFLHEFEGYTFSYLPSQFKRRLLESVLTFNVINPEAPYEAVITIFKRLNTVTTPLSAQELRTALMPGQCVDLLSRLSQSDPFLDATGGKLRDDRLGAQEAILRVLAFSLWPENYIYQDMDGFLYYTMGEINKMPEFYISDTENKFLRSMRDAKKIFGNYAFRKYYAENDVVRPINKSLLESWGAALANLTENERLFLDGAKVRKAIAKMFVDELITNREFDESISRHTSDPKRVALRHSTVRKILKVAIGGGLR